MHFAKVLLLLILSSIYFLTTISLPLPFYSRRFLVPCGNYHRIEDYVNTSSSTCESKRERTVCFHLIIRISSYRSFQESFSVHILEDFISAADNDQTISKFSLAIDEEVHFVDEDITTVGSVVDAILIPRPWWSVVLEPFHWQQPRVHSDIIVSFLRRPRQWHDHLKLLTAVQFPPSAEVCRNSPLFVGRMNCVHPGWGFVLRSYAQVHHDQPFAVWTNYFSSSSALPDNAWVSPDDPSCPSLSQPNRWACAFLSSTNCSLPRAISQCRDRVCNDYTNTWLTSLLDSASEDGEFVPPQRRDLVAGLGRVARADHPAAALAGSLPLAPFAVRAPPLPQHRSLTTPNASLDRDLLLAHSSASLFALGFLLRPTASQRARTARLLAAFYQAAGPRFDRSQPPACVVAHLRRGDRLPPRPLLSRLPEYCLNASRGRPCLQADGASLGPCDPHLGCEDGLPFAHVELRHVLDKVALLAGPRTRTVLLFSDDSRWLRREMDLLLKLRPGLTRSGWNLLVLPPLDPPPPSHLSAGEHLVAETFPGHNFLRFQAGTASGVQYLAALQLASRCGGLVGHFASGATRLFYSAMCLQHAAPGLGSLQGVCPPAYDLRQGLWLP